MYKIILSLFLAVLIVGLVDGRSPRISSGIAAKTTEAYDFAFINVFFEHKWQYCGGVLYRNKWVLTTRTCVQDAFEKVSNITVTFPGPASGFAGGYRVSKVIVQEGVAADWNYEKNFALLNVPTLDTNKRDSAKNRETSLSLIDDATAVYLGQQFRACGLGSTTNPPNFPQKSLICANVTVVAKEMCTTTINKQQGSSTAVAANTGTDWFCGGAFNNGNVCAGDYGGPVYDSSWNVKGFAAYSPNFDRTSGCTGNRNIVYSVVNFATKAWLDQNSN